MTADILLGLGVAILILAVIVAAIVGRRRNRQPSPMSPQEAAVAEFLAEGDREQEREDS